jgi:hypothetical protein
MPYRYQLPIRTPPPVIHCFANVVIPAHLQCALSRRVTLFITQRYTTVSVCTYATTYSYDFIDNKATPRLYGTIYHRSSHHLVTLCRWSYLITLCSSYYAD